LVKIHWSADLRSYRIIRSLKKHHQKYLKFEFLSVNCEVSLKINFLTPEMHLPVATVQSYKNEFLPAVQQLMDR